MPIEFGDLESCDLIVDEIYGGGPTSNQKDDAISKIFPRIATASGAPNSGGVRMPGRHPNRICDRIMRGFAFAPVGVMRFAGVEVNW